MSDANHTEAPDGVIPLFKVFMPQEVIGPLRDVLMSGYIDRKSVV